MLRTIDRYVLKECLWSSLGVILVLLTVLLGNTLVRVLGEIAAGKLPESALMMMLIVNLVNYLVVLVPVGVYLGILLGMGRFYRDSEMSAMYACGIGSFRLYRGVLALALPAMLVTCVLSLYLAPWTVAKRDAIRHDAKYASQLSGLTAGQFNVSSSGSQTLFFERWSDDGQELEQVFLQSRHDDGAAVQTAETAELQLEDGRSYVVFKQGRAYQGSPGQQNYRVIDYQRHGVLVNEKPSPTLQSGTSATPTSELIRSTKYWIRAELHWRLAIPIACLLLALLALPLSHSSPRKGRFGKIGLALLIYIIYTNLLSVGHLWLERALLPIWFGLWWVHGLLALAIVLLLMKRESRGLFSYRRAAA